MPQKSVVPPVDTTSARLRRWLSRLGAWPSLVPIALTALILLATIDDRHVGRAADERQLIWTAVALSQTGQLAQARGHDFTYLAPDGRSVSRFGIGMSLLEVPAAALAPIVEARLGPGSSQPLFLVVPLLLTLLAAACAGEAARLLGAGAGGQRTAVILAGIGSPLGSYAATAFSEPLQGAALAAAYALALGSARARDGSVAARLAWLAGFAASWAVLAKSSMILVAPVVLMPLVASGPSPARMRRALIAFAGLVPGLVVWAWFELLRFGTLFGAYPGEAFSHPIGDGTWRLLIGPNLGFLWFYPAAALAVLAGVRSAMSRDLEAVLRVGPAVAASALMVAMAAGWWAWHGVWGWGPRLLIPAIPLLAATAPLAMQSWASWARRALLVASIALNLPGLLQHAVPVAVYTSNLTWPRVPELEARSVAAYARRTDADGAFRISPDHLLARVPEASQFIVFPWFFWANCCSASGALTALAEPPWHRARPDLLPAQLPMSEAFLRGITGFPRLRFFGRGFFPSVDDARYAAVFDEGMTDQIIRFQQAGAGEAALRLAQRLVRLAPFGENDALILESYRVLGNRLAAAEYLRGLPRDRRVSPELNVVLALFERDAGNDELARRFLRSVAHAFPPGTPLQAAVGAPLANWPPDLQTMIADAVKPAGQ